MLPKALVQSQTHARLRAVWLARYATSCQCTQLSRNCKRFFTASQLLSKSASQRLSRQKSFKSIEKSSGESTLVKAAPAAILRLQSSLHNRPSRPDASAVYAYLQLVEQNFKAIRRKQLLSASDINNLTSTLLWGIKIYSHAKATKNPKSPPFPEIYMTSAFDFAVQLVKDIRMGFLSTSPFIVRQLLLVFQHTGEYATGIEFWQWLRTQQDLVENQIALDADVYGAAILLLADNGAPLEELESLYEEALARYPGNFVSYHLSANAMVIDRTQPVTRSELPLFLLNTMLHIRIIHSDALKAYLTLDTALRLVPDGSPYSSITSFLSNRPLSEAYSVAALACRAGDGGARQRLDIMLNRFIMQPNFDQPEQLIFATRAALNLIFLHIGASGKAHAYALNVLVDAVTRFASLPGFATLSIDLRKELSELLIRLVVSIIELHTKLGLEPQTSVYAKLIGRVAGHTGDPSILDTLQTAMRNSGADVDSPMILSSMIFAAAQLKDSTLSKKWWEIYAASERVQPPGIETWKRLVRALRAVNESSLAEEHLLGKLGSALSESDRAEVYHVLEKEEGLQSDTSTFDIEIFKDGVKKIAADTRILADSIEPGLHADWSGDYYRLPMYLFPSRQLQAPSEEEYRKIYTEYTVDLSNISSRSSSPEMPTTNPRKDSHQPQPFLSRTGIPYDVLRYENWRTINMLLRTAKQMQEAFRESSEMKSGSDENNKIDEYGLNLVSKEMYLDVVGLSDCFGELAAGENVITGYGNSDAADWRDELLYLRGRYIGQ